MHKCFWILYNYYLDVDFKNKYVYIIILFIYSISGIETFILRENKQMSRGHKLIKSEGGGASWVFYELSLSLNHQRGFKAK